MALLNHFSWLHSIPSCIRTTSSLSISSVDGHLGCFHALAAVNSSAVNTEVQSYLISDDIFFVFLHWSRALPLVAFRWLIQ